MAGCVSAFHQDVQPGNLSLSIIHNMAAFLRGKQAGIQGDLSAGILPGLFAPDDQARFGINSQIEYELKLPTMYLC